MKIFQEERLNLTADFIRQKGRVTIHQLAKKFSASIPTVRRDLTELATKGLIYRSHGGAIVKERVLEDYNFEKRMKTSYAVKMKIAQYAVSLIKEGDVIILDTGTTNYCIATLLKNKKNITVITNSLKAAVELAPNKDIKSILVGGYILPESFSMYGSVAIEDVKKFNADKVFLGTAGIHPEKGLTEAYEEEISVKKAMIEVSGKKIVVADHNKLGAISFCSLVPLSKIDTVVTDSGAYPEIKRKFVDCGVKIVYI